MKYIFELNRTCFLKGREVASVYGSVEFCCGLVAMGHDPSASFILARLVGIVYWPRSDERYII